MTIRNKSVIQIRYFIFILKRASVAQMVQSRGRMIELDCIFETKDHSQLYTLWSNLKDRSEYKVYSNLIIRQL